MQEAALAQEEALVGDVLREAPEPVTLVTLAPLTDVALLLRTYPDVANWLRDVVVMGWLELWDPDRLECGGGRVRAEFGVGQVEPAAEGRDGGRHLEAGIGGGADEAA